ncbi:formyltetrahydrofolate deformylase [Brucepastera parasyntrophica]|uniref:formyltetrahydrofolate deformylase n=1 Tax=Brucepastera parasyntrophica TaxID=2880008 RepID=UPI00210D5A66|nr:formyltetrahydrofolate deformylase [Brucepastera parasyntrophica]ULQ58828.1 formyltetrahydrofolate deformylase [Brucepastera parasyntrophica]
MINNTFTLTVSCADQPGLIASITGGVFRMGGNVLNLAQYTATDINMFFCRIVFNGNPSFTEEIFRAEFEKIAEQFAMDWRLFNNNNKARMGILVSKPSHCLYEILLKHADDELDCEIPVIISNHPDLAHIASSFHIPFFQIDTARGKAEYEKDVNDILARYNVDLVVLARYMQIMSPEFCKHWDKRLINIHHGFLPAFKGAKPYHQAWEKGVKIIGATAHFATEDLDQGPIIFQDVIRITDMCSVDEFIRMGKDVERRVLVEAIRRYLNHSIFLYNKRTFIIE